jgi:CBS domain-containing protein
MNSTLTGCGVPLTLSATTAADLMTPSPFSLREEATVAEALACLTDRCIGGVPVIDAAGRLVGVLAESDLIVHAHECNATAGPKSETRATVRDIMTPTVYTLETSAPATKVIEHMRALNIHRIFLVDPDGTMMGVVTALDLLRHLELPK